MPNHRGKDLKEPDSCEFVEDQKKLGDYVDGGFLFNQADAHFADWLRCPVCKKETRHYTKDTHDSPVAKMRLIWCEDCRVVQMQFKQTGNGNEVCMIQNREPTQTVCQIIYKIRKSAHLGRSYFAS